MLTVAFWILMKPDCQGRSLLLHIRELQFRIMDNKKTQESLVIYYRLALIVMIASYIVAITVFAILHFIGA